jgi:hypothetical protein
LSGRHPASGSFLYEASRSIQCPALQRCSQSRPPVWVVHCVHDNGL